MISIRTPAAPLLQLFDFISCRDHSSVYFKRTGVVSARADAWETYYIALGIAGLALLLLIGRGWGVRVQGG